MNTILDLREAVVTGIKALLPTVKSVRAYDGEFDGQELMRHSIATPAVLVAIAGVIKAAPASDGTLCTVRLVAFVLTRDMPAVTRGEGALAIVNALLHGVQEETWALDNVDQSKAVRADSLYDSKIDQKGVALWGVAWEQNITLGTVDASTLDSLVTVNLDYDLAPKDGVIAATDTVTGLDQP